MAVEVFGADRILLGTDTPTFKAEWALSAVHDAEISDSDKSGILRENALAQLRRHDSSLSE
jgi:predicted TIM-barrel fold metal-dependent hydrolase